jgi:hypothetical protein
VILKNIINIKLYKIMSLPSQVFNVLTAKVINSVSATDTIKLGSFESAKKSKLLNPIIKRIVDTIIVDAGPTLVTGTNISHSMINLTSASADFSLVFPSAINLASAQGVLTWSAGDSVSFEVINNTTFRATISGEDGTVSFSPTDYSQLNAGTTLLVSFVFSNDAATEGVYHMNLGSFSGATALFTDNGTDLTPVASRGINIVTGKQYKINNVNMLTMAQDYVPYRLTVGATGADYTSLNSAIDKCILRGGGIIEIIDDIHNYASGGLAKNVSNITFQGKNCSDGTGHSLLFWNSGAGAWTGENVRFRNFVIRGRPGSSGSLLTAVSGGGSFWFENCWLMIDGSTSPSLATSLLNCNSTVCKIYMHNCLMNAPAAPGNRRMVSGDSTSLFYMTGRSQLNATAPSTVYRDAGAIIAAGTITTDTIFDSHNSMANLQIANTAVTYGHINDQTQTIYGIKNFTTGMQIGGTSFSYSESDQSLTIAASAGAWVPTVSPQTFKVVKAGKAVTMSWSAFVGTGGTGSFYITASTLAAAYRPVADVKGFYESSGTSTSILGQFIIRTTGFIEFYNITVSGSNLVTGNFTAADSGIGAGSCSFITA